MEYYLAQLNIAKMKFPLNDPQMADFVNNLDRINGIAESAEGFIWRLKDEQNNATSIKIYNDDFLIVNMSVWKDIDSLFQFTYQTAHVEIFKRRKEWFEKMAEMHMCMWYTSPNYLPSVQDAQERLDHLRNHGETPFSFSFKKRFTAAEAHGFKQI